MLANETKLDPRVKRTHQLLRDAMVELLRETSFEKITVQDITQRAGVNRATFYDRFEDKYALLNYCVREDFQTRLEEKLPPDPLLTLDNLRLLTLLTCDYLRGFIGHCAPTTRRSEQMIMMRQAQDCLYDSILAWVMKSPQPQGEQVVSPEMIAMVTSSAIFGSVMQWVGSGRKLSPEKLTNQILWLLRSGLGAYLGSGV
jgi:AcrR family transcriptional regulator